VTAQDLADLEVKACVEVHAHDDYQVIFSHNRGNFRPWAYPMPKEVAEFIASAVNAPPARNYRSTIPPEKFCAKMDFATAADCVRNLYEEFRHAKRTTGSATLTLDSREMEALRSVSFSCIAAKSTLVAYTPAVNALRVIDATIDLSELPAIEDDVRAALALVGER
jgi:hypothetical protein